MKKGFFACLFALLTVFAGVNYWINSPEYSLLQIKKSIEYRDRYLFEKHVDQQKIIDQIIEEISSILVKEIVEADGTLDYENSILDPTLVTSGILTLFKPMIENVIKDSFDVLWEDDSENEEGYNEMIKWIESTKVSYLVKEGKSARLGLETENVQAEKILVEYRLNKVDNYWRVNKISNLEEIIKTSFLNELEEWLSF